jgi:MFS family permease
VRSGGASRSGTAALGSPFGRLWAASAVSNLADGIAAVAWPWLASAVTRDPVPLALMGVLAGLPWLLFSLPVGVWVDRLDRGRLIAACDGLRAFVLAAVALCVAAFGSDLGDPVAIGSQPFLPPEHQGAWLALLFGAAFAIGIVEVVRDSAAQAYLPQLVEDVDLERANGRLVATEVVTNSLAGPPLGGILIGLTLFLPFGVDSAAFAVAAVLVASIGPRPLPGPAQSHRESFRAQLRTGLRWLWRPTVLRHMAIILGAVNFAAACAMATAVLFAQEVLGTDGGEFGLMMTGAAIGGVLGGVLAARVAGRFGPGGVINGAMLVLGSVLLVASQMNTWQAIWVLMGIEAFTAMVWNVVTVSLRQRLIPQDLFGRVNSVYRFLSWWVIPIGTLLGGVLVRVVEPWLGREAALRAPFVVGGGLTLLALVFSLRWLTNALIAAAARPG